MFPISDFGASPLFWEVLWPCLGFALAALTFATLLFTTART